MLPCPQTAKRYQRKHIATLNCTVSRGKKNGVSGVLEGGYESCVSALTVGRFPVTLLFVIAIGCFGERRTKCPLHFKHGQIQYMAVVTRPLTLTTLTANLNNKPAEKYKEMYRRNTPGVEVIRSDLDRVPCRNGVDSMPCSTATIEHNSLRVHMRHKSSDLIIADWAQPMKACVGHSAAIYIDR